MAITYHDHIEQGTDEWLALRCGILTASEMGLILTPTLKAANNDKCRAHLYELLAQRVTGYVEPRYVTDDMLRGQEDEFIARQLYAEKFAPVEETGFVTNNRWGFTIGYSPDGLVGDDGLIEIKSRRQKYQAQTIIEWIESGTTPSEYLLQCQTGLLVTGRKWIDLISYCGGMPMIPMRIYPDEAVQEAIVSAATDFETKLAAKLSTYRAAAGIEPRLVPTERRVEQEIWI